MSSELRIALDALYTERKTLVDQQKKLAHRISVVEAGIESLSHLVSDGAPEVDLFSAPIIDGGSNDGIPIWKRIFNAMQEIGPAKAKDIAAHILESGYQTNSKNFVNVVGTILRTQTERFRKRDDGLWEPVAENLSMFA